MQLAITEEERGRTRLFRVRGELDIYTAPMLRAAVLAALEGGAESLAFDLSQLEFMDSTGLQILMSAKKRTAERGGEVCILGLSGQVQRVFHLLSLERIFPLCTEADLPGA